MPSRRETLHAGIAALFADALSDCLVQRNTDAPTDWESITESRVLIVRDGGFRRDVITGRTMWTYLPVVEGHIRADDAESLGAPSDALLEEVIALLDDDPTLGGVCDDCALEMEDQPDVNHDVPNAGSMLSWALTLEVEIEQRTES